VICDNTAAAAKPHTAIKQIAWVNDKQLTIQTIWFQTEQTSEEAQRVQNVQI
jgi:hypothetical protein